MYRSRFFRLFHRVKTVAFLRFEDFRGTQGTIAALAPLRRVVTMADRTVLDVSVTEY